ncbi:CHASE domain-containing protein [Cylindrospermopsis raciborskii UAM/DH-MRr]|uniref:CHASE domain-containing sensor histidine kinase n=1 Tax=Cylindrospermopsis raciborskii TaxID=77022 RepID=UPI003879C81E
MVNNRLLIIVSVVGVTLSGLATLMISHWEKSNQQLRFQRQTENLTTALQRSLNRYIDIIEFLGDYYTTDYIQKDKKPIDRSSFNKFTHRSIQIYSGIQALEWAPLISHKERFSYEKQIQLEGYTNFRIRELNQQNQLVVAQKRPYYFPVTYVAPFQGNESAFGYDLNSHPTRKIAISQAIKTKQITTTGRIRLVQERRDQFGFLVFLPVDDPQSKEKMTLPIRGVLIGVFRLSDVVEESLKNLRYSINFIIQDQDAKSGEKFLGQYDATRKTVVNQSIPVTRNIYHYFLCSDPQVCQKTLKMGQRKWRIEFYPSPDYPVEQPYTTFATLIIGCLITSSLVFFLYILNRDLEKTITLSELRFRFFSMASHELRTPLSTILLSSESLQINYDHLTETQKQFNIQRINLTARQMSRQINDLLLLNRSEFQELEFQPEIFNLKDFCQKIIAEIQLTTDHPIELEFSPKLTQVFLDKKLLRSILINLLDNAIKYSPSAIPVQLRITREEKKIIWQIQDSGIGISPDDKPHIYNPFYRGSNVGEIGGTGLGLAIVRACIQRHKGEWKIESELGQGTVVIVKLPIFE